MLVIPVGHILIQLLIYYYLLNCGQVSYLINSHPLQSIVYLQDSLLRLLYRKDVVVLRQQIGIDVAEVLQS